MSYIKERERREQWIKEINENKDKAIQWAIKDNLIEKEPSNSKDKQFILGEIYSRSKGVRAIREKMPNAVIKQESFRNRWDLTVTNGNDVYYIETKHRLYDFNDFTDWMLDYKKYDALCDMDNVYYLSTFYDGVACMWNIKNYSYKKEMMHPTKSVIDAKIIKDENPMYTKNKCYAYWEF